MKIDFSSGGTVIFGIKKYADELQKIINKYHIEINFQQELVAVDGPKKEATFLVKDANGVTTEVKKHFAMIHVTPPQSAPDFISNSPLANHAGWVDVDKYTLQHVRYPNVFSLGDAASTPN